MQVLKKADFSSIRLLGQWILTWVKIPHKKFDFGRYMWKYFCRNQIFGKVMFSANLQVPISSLDGAQIIESLKGQIESTSYAVNKYFPA